MKYQYLQDSAAWYSVADAVNAWERDGYEFVAIIGPMADSGRVSVLLRRTREPGHMEKDPAFAAKLANVRSRAAAQH